MKKYLTEDEIKQAKASKPLREDMMARIEKVLDIVGVGYRAGLAGRTATFHLGYSHPVVFELPAGIDAKIEKTRITLKGIDKELLGRTAATIRGFKKPEPYKGKGIKYADEVIRRKAGKTGASSMCQW